MKYMTFNSSCAYAGMANMLERRGIDVEDREIALGMGLPFLFSCEEGVYSAGPMLQTAKWFDLYLKPIGLCMMESRVSREEVGGFLRSVECGMLGLAATAQSKHAVVYTGMAGQKYCFLNNKRKDSLEPQTFLLSEEELQARLGDTVTVAVLQETQLQATEPTEYFLKSVEVLEQLKRDLSSFCREERSPRELVEGRDRLFRAILLDAVSMLDLIGETELKEKLRFVQGQLLAALREDKPQILQDRISMPALNEAIGIYQRLIQVHIANI